MYKPTLLYVEEFENTLSKKVINSTYVNVILLRFKQCMNFSTEHLIHTTNVSSFVLDKELPVNDEVNRFKDFCATQGLKIDYFYNDSEYNQEIVQNFASILGLTNSLNEYQSRCVRDKVTMKDMLNEIGLKTMSYKELASLDDAINFSEVHGLPMIVKWRRGLSSKEVYKIENIQQLKDLNLDYSKRRFMAEAFCQNLIWCVDALVQDGKVIGTFLTWLPFTSLNFAQKKEKFAQITVCPMPDEIKFDGAQIVQRIVDKTNLNNGYIHLEAFVDTDGQPIICEFAWRTPGEHMLLNHSVAFGIDAYDLLINIMVGRKIEQLILNGQKCVGDMFLPLMSGTISKISTYDDIKSCEGVIAGAVNYKVGDITESKRQYNDCSGWVQVVGDTKEIVMQRMADIYEKFEIIVKP